MFLNLWAVRILFFLACFAKHCPLGVILLSFFPSFRSLSFAADSLHPLANLVVRHSPETLDDTSWPWGLNYRNVGLGLEFSTSSETTAIVAIQKRSKAMPLWLLNIKKNKKKNGWAMIGCIECGFAVTHANDDDNPFCPCLPVLVAIAWESGNRRFSNNRRN